MTQHVESFALGSKIDHSLARALYPFDRVRRHLYALGAQRFASLLVEPQRRAWVFAWAYAALAFLGSVVWPLGLLALGPILWGIPHVLSDVRYLVVSPGHQRKRLQLVLVSLALLAAVLGAGMLAGIGAVLLAALTTQASWARRCVVLIPGTALLVAAWFFQRPMELFFAHAHNWVAVAWLLHLLEKPGHRWGLGIGLLAMSAALWFMPLSWFGFVGQSLGGMGFGYHMSALTPPGASTFAVRLVLLFAFTQAFHYAVWLRLVPELKRRRRAPRSFAASYNALSREFGSWFMICVLLGMVALALGAVFALREAREAYLGFALFHGYLELAFIAVGWLEQSTGDVRAATQPS
jgi:hypothetical protein